VPPVVAVEPAPAAEEVPQTPGEVPRYYEQNAVPEYFKDGDADADINDEEEGSDVETVDTTDGSGIVMDLDPAEYERAENPDVECGKPSATAVARAQYIPDDWNPVIDLSKGQPEELPDDMNPAGWNDFTFRPVFEKKTPKAKATTYVRHELMGGVQVVPLNASGERDAGGGWIAHYNGWTSEHALGRMPQQQEGVPLPDSRRGKLSRDKLRAMGLTKERMGDPMFFMQLLFPLTDPARSGITNDGRLPFYSSVETWTHKYAVDLGLTGSYGLGFELPLAPELVRWDGVVARDGALGGTNGALHRRWRDCSQGDPMIQDCMQRPSGVEA